MAKKTPTLPPMRPRAGTIGEFPAPPPPGSRTPSKPPRMGPSSVDAARDDDVEPTPLVTKKKKKKKPRDPLDVVREAIGELDFLANPQDAAGVCSAALALGLGARAVVIHAYDARAKQIRVVAATGPGADSLIGKTALVQGDAVASTVFSSAAPMKLAIDPDVGLPRRAPERLRVVGAARAVVAMPALVKQRVVALIEVVDAKESAATAVEPAAEYAAIQLARFLVVRKAR